MSIKQTMKQKIKQMVDQDNKFLSFILSIYNHIPLNNKYKLRKNQLQIKSALLNKCKMEAIGGGTPLLLKMAAS